jgi:membrane associated rhomboid family serine protease
VIFIRIIPLPGWEVIGFWFLMQVLNMGASGQVAWGAHVGGFLTGIALYPAFRFLRWKEA